MKKLFVSDCTLKEAALERQLSFREKTNLARCLDSLGIDAIELPAIKNPREDAIIYKTIAAAVKNSEICIPVGCDEASVEAAYDCVRDAKCPCLQLALPTSTVGMEYSLHLKAPVMLKLIERLIKACRALCERVEFVALDASRADREFLKSACQTAEDNGAALVTLTDDAGILLPDEFAAMTADIKAGVTVPVFCQPSDALNMAAACAAYAIKAGADGIKTSIFGKFLSPDMAAELIRSRGYDLGIDCSLAVTEIHRRIADVLHGQSSVLPVNPKSGTDGLLLKNGDSLGAVCDAIYSLGYELSEEDCGHVYEEFRRVSAMKPSVGARELEAIVASAAMQVPSTYHLESYVVTNGNVISAMANVTLIKNGERLSGVSSGDGPIDASFLAIEQIIGHHYELDDFQIQAVTEGREAMGSALVKLRSDGKLYSGNGLSTDIVGSSIRAFINALNKIVYEEN